MSSRKILASLLMASCASAKSGINRRQEACTAALLIDDFSQWEEGLNLLEGAAGCKLIISSSLFPVSPSHNFLHYIYIYIYSKMNTGEHTNTSR